jgi:hypothetical protein
MSIDYQAQDEALDDEIRALYAPETEDDADDPSADSLAPASTESTEPSAADLDESTLPDDTEKPATEATVPESRYQNAVLAMNRAQQELSDKRKQEADKDALIQSLQAQLQAQTEAPASTQSPTDDDDDDEDLEEAREIYPEVINPLLKRLAQLEKKLAAVNADVGTVKHVAERYQQSEQQSAEDRHWSAIKAKHGDVDEIAQSAEYADWYHNQSPLIQQALRQGTAHDVISALNLFRAEHPASVPDTIKQNTIAKPDKLAAAKAASTPVMNGSRKTEPKPAYTTAQIAKMSRDEFMKHEAAIDEALARGEIM